MEKLEKKFLSAIDSGKLKLEVGRKSWYSYVLEIQKLVWERNMRDGYNIFIFDKKLHQVAEINIDQI